MPERETTISTAREKARSLRALRDIKQTIMWLAAIAVISLVLVTWALGRLGTWITVQSSILSQMEKEGADLETDIAGMADGAHRAYLPIVEAVVGIFFLYLLWRLLFSRRKESAPDSAIDAFHKGPKGAGN